MAQATFAALQVLVGISPVRRASGLARAVRDLRKNLKSLRDPYRPELHYMRGPGPKWHEKHAGESASGF